MKIQRVLVLSLAIVSMAPGGQPGSGYHITGRMAIGGEGGWDYLLADSGSRRLFVSHGTRVVVMDIESGNVLGEIPKTEGVHGIALAPQFHHGFTSNGRSSTVTIFDLQTLAIIKEVPTGKNPDAILFDPFSEKLFTFNGRSQDASVLDPATGDSVATIPLGGKPEFAVSDRQGHIYVNDEDNSMVLTIDARTLQVIARWPLAPGESPSGLAIDAAHRLLFSVCRNNRMMVMDADSGRIVASLPIGSGVDGCAFDPGTGLAFSSNGEGTLTVIREESPASFSVVDTVKTQRGARTIALDLKTHAVFLPTAEFGPAPPATAENARPRPPVLPDTFVVLTLNR